jgi:hypothetical protein
MSSRGQKVYPLLSEILPGSRLARAAAFFGISPVSGLSPRRAALVFLVLGVACAALSVIARADVLIVQLKKGGRDLCAEFGYLYELDYGLLFVTFAPLICLFGLKALAELQASLSLVSIGAANRKFFNRFVIAGLIAGSFGFTFGTEFFPERGHNGKTVWGAYQDLAFGYVQAAAVANYSIGPLEDTWRKTDDERYRGAVITVRPDGPRGWRVLVFFVFLFVALTTQSLYACVQWWILLKLLFIFLFLTFAVWRETAFWRLLARFWGRDAMIKVDPYDMSKKFGLVPIISSGAYSPSWRLAWSWRLSGYRAAKAFGASADRPAQDGWDSLSRSFRLRSMWGFTSYLDQYKIAKLEKLRHVLERLEEALQKMSRELRETSDADHRAKRALRKQILEARVAAVKKAGTTCWRKA